jgi:hypothetical protein
MPDQHGNSTALSRRNTVRLHFAVIACFGLLTLLVLNRLALNLNTVVSDGPLNDYHLFTWNYWWIDYAVNTLHTTPYFTDFLLFPTQHNLAFHTLTPILYPIYKMLSMVLGDPATLNAILWGSFILTGYVTFLFLKSQINNTVSAFVGSLLFTFLPAMLDHAINYHANMWLMAWIPGLLLVWERVARHRTLAWAALFGVGLWGVWMTDLQYLIWMPCLLIPFGMLTLRRNWSERGRIIGLGAASLVIMLLLAMIAPLPALMQEQGVTSPARYLTAQAYSVPPEAFLLNPPDPPADRSIGRLIVVLTVAAIVLGRGARVRWMWLAVGIVPLVLSLGPTLLIGTMEIPIPYRIVHDALGGMYRFPSRFAPIGVLALLVFIGLSFQIRQRLWVAGALILLLAVDERWLAPFPIQEPLSDYQIYHTIAQDEQDYVIVDVPLTVHSGWAQVGGDQGQRAMWYQRVHHKRQVNGSLSRIADVEPLFYEQSPLLGWFASAHELDFAAASAELTKLTEAWPIGYVMVHLNWLTPEQGLAFVGFLNQQSSICLVTQERDLVVYRARRLGCPEPQDALKIDFGQQGDEAYLVDGWYPRESIGGSEARWAHDTIRLSVPLREDIGYRLTFRALGYGEDRTVSIQHGGKEVANVTLTSDWETYTVTIPAQSVDTPVLTLVANGSLRPVDVEGSGDVRSLSIAVQWMEFTPMTQ